MPLQPSDEEPSLNLKILIDEVYDQAGFDLAIDYTQATVLPLKDLDKEWAKGILNLLR